MLLMTEAELDNLYERSKNKSMIVGSEVRQLIGEIRQHRRLDRVDAGLATQLRRSIERNAQLHERLAEIRRYVEQWLAAYPLKVFPEPDLEKVAKVLKDNDLTLDAVSANMGRHVLTRLLEFINQPSTAA
jgi:hypothetical protein